MTLPVKRPFPPMEAMSVSEMPAGPDWQYEPKWDGFRCLVFRDGKRIDLQSKAGQPLTRYFPELVEAFGELGAERFVLDGEIVVPDGPGFSFDALLQRIHPAESRVKRLAVETPALFIAFDILADQRGRSLVAEMLEQRRQALETFAKSFLRGNKVIRLSPVTTRPAEARKWIASVGSALDGIIAKRRDKPYASGKREAMQKIKNHRSADCVVGGFRYNEGKKVVGSLLLGLYDEDGLLHHVGFTSGLKNSEKPELTERLEKLIAEPGFTGDKPGGPSRWASKRSAEWKPLKPKLVVEVGYDHFSGGRFRHGTTLLRWRPDKSPKQCTMDQLRQKRADLQKLLK